MRAFVFVLFFIFLSSRLIELNLPSTANQICEEERYYIKFYMIFRNLHHFWSSLI